MAKKFNTENLIPWAVAIVLLIGVGIVVYLISRKKSKDGFHFEVTPARRGSLGPYLTQSGPNHELCKKMWSTKEGREQISEHNCLNGQCGVASGMIPPGKFLKGNPPPGKPWGVGQFMGRPLHFEYTPESDANWNNPRCNPRVQKNIML